MSVKVKLIVLLSKEESEKINVKPGYMCDVENPEELYNFVDPKVHKLAYKSSETIFNLKKYREEYNDPEITIIGVNEKTLELSNGRKFLTKDVETIEKEIDIIRFVPIVDLGNRVAFSDKLFDDYNNKQRFQSYFPISYLDEVYNFKKYSKEEIDKILEKYHKVMERLYIHVVIDSE